MPLVLKSPTVMPPPGLYVDLPMEEYLGWGAASKSLLEAMSKTPAHGKASMDYTSTETPATRLGTAVHSAILEPEMFEAEYAMLPEGDGRSAAVKAARAGFVESNLIPLKPSEWEVCTILRDKAWAKSSVRDLLEQATHVEVSGLFQTVHPGIFGKVRPDLICADAKTCVDLKTCADASPQGFAKSIGEYGYHLSHGWYLPALRALGQRCDHWIWVALEKVPPYGIAVYSAEQHDIQHSIARCQDLLDLYARCIEGNVWPDYPDHVLPIATPDWGKR